MRHIIVCCLLVLFACAGIVISQNEKMQQIKQEQQALQQQLDALTLEEQRLERMQEYVQTDEYLEQYAREKFGYVKPEDYKFYREDE